MKLLFVASEAYPLVKTGGLGDVAYSLPRALHQKGADVRLLLPGYRSLLGKLGQFKILGWLALRGAERMHSVRILETQHPAFPFPVWIADCPALFDRPGNPYVQPEGYDWGDNAERFTVFARAATELACDALALGWKPEVVHAHDWQTGLVPAFLDGLEHRPKRIFTIHNLAYNGRFSQAEFTRLQLPSHWWSPEGAEFYGNLSMLKAGIVYADAVTTVSPTYAREICTPAFGYGLEGLLLSRHYKLHGILNGVDSEEWNPAADPHLAATYSSAQIQPGKHENKIALLKHFLHRLTKKHQEAPLIGMVSRLVEQKGVDLVLGAIPTLLAETDANFVLVGAGNHYYEQHLRELAVNYPKRVFVHIGYDESLAHLLEAGADMFLMPSRFEPCGLNQMYSLHYGTPPVVYHTGGLADTVNDTNGFVFYEPTVSGLLGVIRQALHRYAQPEDWLALQLAGMQQDLGWDSSAAKYLTLYRL